MQEHVLIYRRHKTQALLLCTASWSIAAWCVYLSYINTSIFFALFAAISASVGSFAALRSLRLFERIYLRRDSICRSSALRDTVIDFKDIEEIRHKNTAWSLPCIDIVARHASLRVYADIKDYAPLYLFLRSNIGVPTAKPARVDDVIVKEISLIYDTSRGRTDFELQAKDSEEKDIDLGTMFPSEAAESLYFHIVSCNPNCKQSINKKNRSIDLSKRAVDRGLPIASCALAAVSAMAFYLNAYPPQNKANLANIQKPYEASALDELEAPINKIRFIDLRVFAKPTHPKFEVYEKYRLAMKFLDHQDRGRAHIQKAEQLLRTAEDLDPRFPPVFAGLARVALARAYKAGAQYDFDGINQAQKYLNAGIAIDPSYAVLHTTQADIYVITRKYRRSLQIANNLLRSPSQTKSALSIRSQTYLAKGDYEQAATALRKYLKIDPGSIWALQELAEVLEFQNEFEAAEDVFTKLTSRKASPWVHHNYALYLRRRGRLEESIQRSRYALQHSKHSAIRKVFSMTNYMRGSQLLWDDRNEQASIAFFETAYKSDPDNADALYGLGAAFAELARRDDPEANLKKSVAFLKAFVKARPENKEVRQFLGTISKELDKQQLVH